MCTSISWQLLSLSADTETRALLSMPSIGSLLGQCQKNAFLIIVLTRCALLNIFCRAQATLCYSTSDRQWNNLLWCSCIPPVGKVKLGRYPAALALMLFVLWFDFSCFPLCIFVGCRGVWGCIAWPFYFMSKKGKIMLRLKGIKANPPPVHLWN